MSYIPKEELEEVLNFLKLREIEELFSHIPKELFGEVKLEKGLSEEELRRFFLEVDSLNKNLIIFAGGGAYDRVVPAVIPYLISRGEFLTSYTPYQPEASYGTLKALYDYQTYMCKLTGMEVSNAGVYDGATALAEGVLMARRIKGVKRGKVLVSSAVNPLYRQVLRTYLYGVEDELVEAPFDGEGRTSLKGFKEGEFYCFVVQQPNFFGILEDLKALRESLREALMIVVVGDSLTLSLLKPPSLFGAEIVVGETQSFGVPLSFGGPYNGFLTTKKKYIREVPGRIVGKTTDLRGREAYTLVLQTREQHIRRERATSNLCTNQTLVALANTIYLKLLGMDGLRKVATNSLSKALYLKEKLLGLGFKQPFKGKHLWEFVLCHERALELRKELLKRGFLLGIPLKDFYEGLEDCLLICATEKRTKGEIDALVKNLREIL